MENLLEVKNLQFSFRTYGGVVKAVRDVSFEVRPGEILGIVGESGCGKSVTSQCLMRLNPEPPGFFEGGEILYKGKDVLKMNKKELRQFRGKEISYIFQDPMTSLHPTMRIGKQIEEVFVGRKGMSAAEKKAKALEILKMVGISDGERRYKQYPHELSGGMKQRVMIAIALVGSPSIVIADEPTTSLDVTIEAQILDVLKNLQKTLGTSIILITHDLGVIAKLCDRVLVMYGGKIVERGSVDEISMIQHILTQKDLCIQLPNWIQQKATNCSQSKEHLRICLHLRKDVRSQQDVNTAWKSVKICRHRLMSFQKNMKPVAGCSMNMHRIQT